MEREITNTSHIDENLIGVKSWTAYLLPIFISISIGAIMIGLNTLLGIIPFVYCLYSILLLRTYKLYFDPEGVWLYSGLFPWQKGIRGVKWRDLDEAVYFTGFSSWLFKSYKIRIGHRFTKEAEIFLSHMHLGDKIVQNINAVHQLAIQNNATQ